MRPAPERVGGLAVVCYMLIDARHVPTGATRHVVEGGVWGPAAGLAICRDGDAYYLFGCDGDWRPATDTWHASLEDAQDQAEFEYAGTGRTWIRAGAG